MYSKGLQVIDSTKMLLWRGKGAG